MEQLDFRISSNLKNIIGKELITNDLIAIFELVKNSYDANASCVQIEFVGIKDVGNPNDAKIIIKDDGHGMSRQDIVDKWLFVGYSEKKELDDDIASKKEDFRDKIQNKRPFAGAKGIGRFSCDRLGRKLTIYTKRKGESVIHKLIIDWSLFEKDSKEQFQTIKVNYIELSSHDVVSAKYFNEKDPGTVLEITDLNDTWDRKKLIRLKRTLQRLVNPVDPDISEGFKIFLRAREFLTEDGKYSNDLERINGLVENILFERLGILTTLIDCKISKDGDSIETSLIDKDKFIFRIEEKNTFKSLKNLHIKLFYLNASAKRSFSRLMGLQPVNYGSIFLYRNYFRVHPYGDEGDDWLGLEKRKGQGYSRFLGTRELMGRIELNGYQPEFNEVTSRDGGVIKNEAYNQLQDFFKGKALRRLEKYVVEAIDWDRGEDLDLDTTKMTSIRLMKEFVGQTNDPDVRIEFNEDLISLIEQKEVEKAPELVKNLEVLKKFVQSKKAEAYIDEHLKSLRKSIQRIEKEKKIQTEELNRKERELAETSATLTAKTIEISSLKDEIKHIDRENVFLKSVTDKEKTEILSLNHQIGISSTNIQNYIELIKIYIYEKREIPTLDLKKYILGIDLESKKIKKAIEIVTHAKFEMDTESVKIDIVAFIEQYITNVYKELLKRKGRGNIGLSVVLEEGLGVIKWEIKPLEFSIIIDNIIDNAIKSHSKNILVTLVKNGEKGIKILFTNDGDPIPPETMKRIFDFGFTTTDGSGIGLHHVREVVGKMHGTVEARNIEGNGVEFAIIFSGE